MNLSKSQFLKNARKTAKKRGAELKMQSHVCQCVQMIILWLKMRQKAQMPYFYMKKISGSKSGNFLQKRQIAYPLIYDKTPNMTNIQIEFLGTE